jgi:8-oxo-dGTP pyrophosphatase MutT (NUDIX family)
VSRQGQGPDPASAADDAGGANGEQDAISADGALKRTAPAVDGSRARYRLEVTPEHLGERVSLRSLVDDGDGPRPTDRVGRLLSFERDGIIIADRKGHLHIIDPLLLVASRLVPAHPRLAPEPSGRDPEDPIERAAARVVLLDPDDRMLLIAHLPGDGRRIWTAPGGGLDADEDHRTAAARELAEEVGIAPPLGPWVWSRSAVFAFRGIWLRQHERWFSARSAPLDAATLPLADLATEGARWWALEELAVTDEVLAPRALADHLATLLRDGPPDEPVDVGA